MLPFTLPFAARFRKKMGEKLGEQGQSYVEYIILVGALILVAAAIYIFRDEISGAFKRMGEWIKSAW